MHGGLDVSGQCAGNFDSRTVRTRYLVTIWSVAERCSIVCGVYNIVSINPETKDRNSN